jgi:hypothetical protein
MEFLFVVLADGPFLEHHYFCLTEIYCQVPGLTESVQNLGDAVGPPWLVTEQPDHQQIVEI